MSTLENRRLALQLAFGFSAGRQDVIWTTVASDALNFLETGSFAPAATAPVAADPTPAAPKKPRTPAKAAESAASAPAPVQSAASINAPPNGAALPATPIAAVATPNKEPTLDDVRTALVQCQTRKGGKDVPQAILSKYSSNKTTGGLPKDKYSAVISECAAA